MLQHVVGESRQQYVVAQGSAESARDVDGTGITKQAAVDARAVAARSAGKG